MEVDEFSADLHHLNDPLGGGANRQNSVDHLAEQESGSAPLINAAKNSHTPYIQNYNTEIIRRIDKSI